MFLVLFGLVCVFGLVFLCRENFAESDTGEKKQRRTGILKKKRERKGRCK